MCPRRPVEFYAGNGARVTSLVSFATFISPRPGAIHESKQSVRVSRDLVIAGRRAVAARCAVISARKCALSELAIQEAKENGNFINRLQIG